MEGAALLIKNILYVNINILSKEKNICREKIKEILRLRVGFF